MLVIGKTGSFFFGSVFFFLHFFFKINLAINKFVIYLYQIIKRSNKMTEQQKIEAKQIAKELASKWNQDEETIYSFIVFLDGREPSDALMQKWYAERMKALNWIENNPAVVENYINK